MKIEKWSFLFLVKLWHLSSFESGDQCNIDVRVNLAHIAYKETLTSWQCRIREVESSIIRIKRMSSNGRRFNLI